MSGKTEATEDRIVRGPDASDPRGAIPVRAEPDSAASLCGWLLSRKPWRKGGGGLE
jgi:hypothetical protein